MVNKKVARLWEKLTGHRVELKDKRWQIEDAGGRPYWACYNGGSGVVPDPATQPWEWVKLFDDTAIDRLLGTPGKWGARIVKNTYHSAIADTPELALAAAVAKMAEATEPVQKSP